MGHEGDVGGARAGELERKLAYRARMEELVLEVSRRFMAVEEADLEGAIGLTLEDCARFAGVDAAHLLRVSEDGATFSLTNLWRDPASLPAGASVADLERDVPIEKLAPPLRAGQTFKVDDVESLPDGLPVKENLRKFNIGAVAGVPLLVGGRLIGSTGLSCIGRAHAWTEEELLLARFFADTVAHALTRARAARERAALEARLHAAERLETVGRLAGGVAHDFNNLLLVILGAGELATLEADDPARVRVHLGAIRDAATRASELTRQLLTFSRRQPTNKRSLDLNALIDGLAPLLRRLLPETIRIDLVKGHGLAAVHADAGQIEQVLVNLAANSRDAMPAGGRLTIETRNVEIDSDRSGTPALARPGPYVLLSVTDTGVGIPPENLGRIFDPFFTTKDIGKGTGLGLASVYGIVQGHDGAVRVDSEVDRGARFEIYLPAEAAAAIAPPEAPGEILRGHETLLVGEDDAHVRWLLEALLESAGYRVVTAASGAEVLERFARSPDRFDLVLLDVVMPVVSGDEAARRLRAERPELPVILMSGYPTGAMRDGAPPPGVPLIQKPFQPDALLRAIRHALSPPSAP